MHARMSIFGGPPHMLDEGVRQAREVVLPQAKETDPGFKGIIALTDRQVRKMVWITFWESEEANGRLRGRGQPAARGGDGGGCWGDGSRCGEVRGGPF